jgi:hypothetical protein
VARWLARAARWYIDGVSRAVVYLAFAMACSSKAEPPRSEPPAPGDPSAPALAREPEAEPIPERPEQVPPGRAPGRPAQPRGVRPIEVVLRSSPPGALAAVDGKAIGTTPAYWAGDADGREREFTFALHGYAPARYRFVPITSGVIHARLEVLADESDAGVPERDHAPADAIAPQAPRTPAVPDAGPAPSEAPTSGAGPEP